MGMEAVKSQFVQDSVQAGSEECSILLHEGANEAFHQGSVQPIKFGSQGIDEPVLREENSNLVADFPKDAVDEWPAPKQVHSFYFVKYRPYEDPKLRAKLEPADKEIQKKTRARSQIIDKLKAKRSDRAQLIAQMKPLKAENRQFWNAMDERRKEMEPLQQALGKLRNTNSSIREKGVCLCSSEEELNNLIKSLHYRIQHESIPLTEEKQLLRYIKQLEGTREKVLANAAMRAKIQDSLGEKAAIQDQVKLMGVNLDEVRKDQQTVKAKLKQLTNEEEAIVKEIKSLEEELTDVTEKRDKANEAWKELNNQRNEGNTCFYKNQTLLRKARDLAAKKDIEALAKIGSVEVENFMSSWNESKTFRDDYERRILQSLDIRQLSRDGRLRNPDEKPLILLEANSSSETVTVAKTNVKPKEDPISSLLKDTSLVDIAQNEAKNKPQKEAKKNKLASSGTAVEPTDLEDNKIIIGSKNPQKASQSEPNELDEAKLKEKRRDEEIAKANKAMERKKKLAEKAAAKAAIKAQKEAEKKLKDREKKVKKKAAASASVPEPEEQPTEVDAKVPESERAVEKIEAPVSSNNKERKENLIRYRSRPKGPDSSLPRVLLKRKKPTTYWVWAAPAALSVMVLLIIGYNYLL